MPETKPQIEALAPSHVFMPGAVMKDGIGHYVDCSNDPYDLRPAADVIIGAATKMLETLPQDTPLVILMGEQHFTPAHKELQHLVTARLVTAGLSPTVCFEQPHNSWAGIAQTFMAQAVPSSLFYNPGADPDGRLSLSTFITVGCSGGSPLAWQNMMAFCYRHVLRTSFNDAALICDLFDAHLDLNDPATAAAAQTTDKGEIISATATRGVAARNAFMAARGMAVAQQNNSRLVMQITGLDHVFGNAADDHCYEDSLHSHYRSGGAAVLPVFITSRRIRYGINVLPAAARAALSSSVVIDGLSEDTFYTGDWPSQRACIARIHEHSGNEIEFYNVAAQGDFYRGEAEARVRVLLKSHGLHL